MTDVSDWIYCRVVDRGTSGFAREPFWLGQVEYSAYGQERAYRSQLDASMHDFGLEIPENGWSRVVRARLILPRVSKVDVARFGTFHLVESIRALRAGVPIVGKQIRLLDAGYMLDAVAGEVTVLRAAPREFEMPMSAFAFDELATFPGHIINTLLVAPSEFGELGDAYRKSAHWGEVAMTVTDESQQLLLLWMAAECLCKVSQEEDIVPKLIAAAGMPSGARLRSLSPDIQRSLALEASYRAWRNKLKALAGTLRRVRNHIVHAGFRHVDLPNLLGKPDVVLGRRFLEIVVRSLGTMALCALQLRHRRVVDMWHDYHHAFPRGVVEHARVTLRELQK